MRVFHDGPDVEGLVVIEDEDPRLLRSRRTLLRVELSESSGRLGLLPCLLVQYPVQANGTGQAERLDVRSRRLRFRRIVRFLGVGTGRANERRCQKKRREAQDRASRADQAVSSHASNNRFRYLSRIPAANFSKLSTGRAPCDEQPTKLKEIWKDRMSAPVSRARLLAYRRKSRQVPSLRPGQPHPGSFPEGSVDAPTRLWPC